MSDESHFIGQIQQKEKEVAKMLEDAEKKNNKRVLEVNESAGQIVIEAEEGAKKIGQECFKKVKEEGKGEYKRILAELANKRRDEIEGGKVNLEKAKKHIHDAFLDMFESHAAEKAA